ncbi:hypothetical protein [Nocardia jinanensis]|uniref:Uncharacterized protein n=1 Tax=Nocardia jinanensis TaxID=382504 RepID=A0A917VSF4_9NOCA|nr:hypothetical protein [Nocardia jinanensis]GGL09703.1 hypothetical protein GCM10011588_25110 [Nocardia jinanensis]
MSDENHEDLEATRRTLRIERAATAVVLHGYRGDKAGVAHAADALFAEGADIADVVVPLAWALARLPRGLDEPTELLDRLAALHCIGDRPPQ